MGRIAGVTAEETRARLLAAAGRVLAEQGFGGARVGDIAREAGLTTGAIYAHFRSKAELLAEATGDAGAHELGSLVEGLGGGDVVEVLRALAKRLGRPPADDDGSLLIESAVAARRDPEAAARLVRDVADREAALVAVLELAADRRAVADDLAPAAVSRLAMTLALGSLVVRALRLEPVAADDWNHLSDRLVDSLLPTTDTSPDRTELRHP